MLLCVIVTLKCIKFKLKFKPYILKAGKYVIIFNFLLSFFLEEKPSKPKRTETKEHKKTLSKKKPQDDEKAGL